MKPYDEQEVLDNLRTLRKLAVRIKDSDLLEILARDDQPNNSRDPDPFHKQVDVGICKQLRQAVKSLQSAVNICAFLLDTSPKPGRTTSLVDCLACGQPALPKVVKGLCGECLKEYTHGKWQTHGDYVAWKKSLGPVS